VLPRYHLELNFEVPDRATVEESPNYALGFTCLGIGVAALTIGLVWMYVSSEDQSAREFPSICLIVVPLCCCVGISAFFGSTIVLDRDRQTLAVCRHFFRLRWERQYLRVEIEQLYEALAFDDWRFIAIEFTDLRRKRLTLWPRRRSLSDETARLSNVLKKFRKHQERKTGHVHHPMTEDNRWALMKASADYQFRLHLRRTLLALLALVVWIGAVILLVQATGGKDFAFRRIAGLGMVLVFIGLMIFMTFEVSLMELHWTDIRKMRKIDERFGPPT